MSRASPAATSPIPCQRSNPVGRSCAAHRPQARYPAHQFLGAQSSGTYSTACTKVEPRSSSVSNQSSRAERNQSPPLVTQAKRACSRAERNQSPPLVTQAKRACSRAERPHCESTRGAAFARACAADVCSKHSRPRTTDATRMLRVLFGSSAGIRTPIRRIKISCPSR